MSSGGEPLVCTFKPQKCVEPGVISDSMTPGTSHEIINKITPPSVVGAVL